MAIQCEHCYDLPAIANVGIIWIDDRSVSNENVYLCSNCIDIRYPCVWKDD